ncbi:hypothetical protein [Pseudomonas sp. AN3A02]|uniref:hypothetical protein n=1 Tax=Pseudomonas sp. AN3A02 TaxID=2719587 RepID=UPI001431E14E|nr:hypothetical protein [Pseudomonas sp. AN3A02]NIL20075.1 hypothetical protein [Pseudomonas sp. AN3A02]
MQSPLLGILWLSDRWGRGDGHLALVQRLQLSDINGLLRRLLDHRLSAGVRLILSVELRLQW